MRSKEKTKIYYFKMWEKKCSVWPEDKGTNYGLDVYPKHDDKRLSFKMFTMMESEILENIPYCKYLKYIVYRILYTIGIEIILILNYTIYL